MSREIKFRAWDKKTNKMYSVASIDMFGGVVTLLDDGGDILDLDFIERPTHNVELMQATGLLDKNDMDVYEGDILAYPDKYGKYTGSFQCNWGETSCGCCDTIIGYDTGFEGMTIIGNIWEHGHLLENESKE